MTNYASRKRFVPVTGGYYRNAGGGDYVCLRAVNAEDTAIMQNRASKWTLTAHGIGIYDDGTIDWDYSTGGYFA